MNIKSISLNNYKAFIGNQKIEIRPLTILIGKNSSGKSSIAKLFTLLENSLSGTLDEPLVLKNNNVELGSDFLDLVHNRKPNIPIELNLEFNSGMTLFVSVVQDSSEYRLIIFEWKYKSPTFTISLTYNPSIGYTDENGEIYECKFKGFVPVQMLKNGEDILNNIDPISKVKVDYIGPFRILPERQFYLSGRLHFNDTGSKGENAYPILGASKLMKSELHKNVGDWFKQHFSGWKLVVEDKNRPYIELKLEKNNSSVNIVDVGQGMNQALPLVVRSYMNIQNSLIILEQPELHLHPAAHGDLAELFAYSTKTYNQRFILETHSENILLRLRALIVENKFGLTPEDLVIYWIDDADSPSHSVSEILVDAEGTLTDWPSGVFNENIVEIQQMRSAINKKRSNDNKI